MTDIHDITVIIKNTVITYSSFLFIFLFLFSYVVCTFTCATVYGCVLSARKTLRCYHAYNPCNAVCIILFKTESWSMNISISYKKTTSIRVSVTVRVRTFAGDIGTLSFGSWSRLSYNGNIAFINLQIIS